MYSVAGVAGFEPTSSLLESDALGQTRRYSYVSAVLRGERELISLSPLLLLVVSLPRPLLLTYQLLPVSAGSKLVVR